MYAPTSPPRRPLVGPSERPSTRPCVATRCTTGRSRSAGRRNSWAVPAPGTFSAPHGTAPWKGMLFVPPSWPRCSAASRPVWILLLLGNGAWTCSPTWWSNTLTSTRYSPSPTEAPRHEHMMCGQGVATPHPLRRRLKVVARAAETSAAPNPTRRARAVVRSMSEMVGGRPSPRTGRCSVRAPYRLVPPRRSPRAPAKDDSTTPALGLGWAPASRHHVHRTEPARPGAQAAVKAAAKRAPGRLSRSSRRAEAQPNRSYRALRWPTMASSVLTARWANRPGTPATAPQRGGATTASAVFSATDSTTARDTSTVSNTLVSRPTRDLSRRRAPGRSSCSNSTRTAAASRSRERPPSTTQVATAVTAVRAIGARAVTRSATIPNPVAAPTRNTTWVSPRARESEYKRCSNAVAAEPKAATGWNRRGSPNHRSAPYRRKLPAARVLSNGRRTNPPSRRSTRQERRADVG